MSSNVTTSRRWVDFPVSSNVSVVNTWLLAQDNLPNSNGGIGNTFRMTIPSVVQNGSNGVPLTLLMVSNVASLPAANLYPNSIVLVANATGGLMLYSSNGSVWASV